MQQPSEPHSQPIVHVRGDSETELDLLFSVLTNNESSPGQTYRNKNLPLSFFQPPEKKTGSHSREGSHDLSTFTSGPIAAGVYNHIRSNSSPAQLPMSMSLPPVAQHMKQGSVDVIGDNSSQQQSQQQQPPSTVNWMNTASKFLLK